MRFTSVPRLLEFLGVKGHACFSDRIVLVKNVKNDQEDANEQNVYVALLGAAGFAQHYGGIRRHPNAVLVADCSAGPTSQFLKVVVRTPNGVGALTC